MLTGRSIAQGAARLAPLLACLTLAPFAARGQAPLSEPPAAPNSFSMPPGSLDGRTFGGIDLPAPAQEISLSLAADRAWAWRESNTERVLLERDVRVTLGPYTFQAERCVAWIEPVRIAGADAEQVALYFDRVVDLGGSPVASEQAERLLVTAVITRPGAGLRTDLLREQRPASGTGSEFVQEAEARLVRYLATLLPETNPSATPGTPGAPGATPGGPAAADRRAQGSPGAPVEGAAAAIPSWIPPDDRAGLAPATRTPIIEPAQGLVSFFAENIQSIAHANPGERAILLTGGVTVQYTPMGPGMRQPPPVQISAQRAVAFLSQEADASLTRQEVQSVLGVYLEGDVVATSGSYTLRGARVFYDVRRDRAVVLDAVFWTYDQERGMPIYLRAATIRQESINQWAAKDVRMANVAFAEPQFSIGATDVTLTRSPASADGVTRERTDVTASEVTFRFGSTPVFYLPGVEGEVRPSPLKRISIDSEGGDPILRTGWDLYTILGLDAAPGNSATLLLDGYFNRGPAGGLDLGWRTEELRGSLLTYGIYDDGRDRLPSGSEVRHDNEFRGLFVADQVWNLAENWTLFLEGTYISDETFVPAFFRSDAETRREYVSSIYARRLDENTGFEFEARGTFNDFLSNEYLLQSQGYTTEKLPEAAYHRLADDLWGGVLSWSSDYSLSALRLAMHEPTARETGFRSVSKARAAFGLAPDQSPAEVLRAQGYSEGNTYRADMRQEIEAPLRAGALNIVPFVSGRATAWDDNFDEFSDEPSNDPYRFWGSGGIRFFTTLQRVDEAARIPALDATKIRHIIEPSATVWHAATTLDQNDLPVYDQEVESIAHGSAARVGVRNTVQTYRGGLLNPRSVDLLTVDTNYIWSSTDVDQESPYGRFIEARPEDSLLGEFASNDTVFAVTDALSITNSVLYDVDNASLARVTIGGIIDHGFGFSTLVEYRELDKPRATLLDLVARYEISRKHAVLLSGTYDVERSEFQSAGMRLERRFPQWTVDFRFEVDNVTNDVSVGLALRPVGLAGESRNRVLTRDLSDRAVLHQPAPQRERLEEGPLAP